jgi:preprotein translocase subunit SecD
MARLKKILTNPRVIILLACLLLGLFAINPRPWNDGVQIKSITRNSSAELAGFENPKASISPMGRERIIAMNNKPILDIDAYYKFVLTLEENQTISIKTTKNTYKLLTKPKYHVTVLNETETILVDETIESNETINGTVTLVNKTIQKEVEQSKVLREVIGVEPLGFAVGPAPKSNLREGLDLQGGTRVLLKPAEQVPAETMSLMIDSLKERLNVYGLGDVVVNEISDRPGFIGGGNKFILVEIAGASEEEVRDLLGKQGKFEAKIGSDSVFKGGNDITYVCRTAQCSGIDPNRGCGTSADGWGCSFMFSITLSPEAAQRQADLTSGLTVVSGSLSEPLVLYLDDQEVDRLNIAADLRGRATTDIAISGGGKGATEQAAMEDALKNMKRLQTVLITGSLPVKLEIERIDGISATLGKTFLTNALYVWLLALAGVAVVLVLVYRKFIIAVPIVFTAISEIFLTLAIAALIGWNIDLAAIAGLILAVGEGTNDQVVITDEAIRKESDGVYNWKERIKRAFFIIFSAYMTMVVAMLPLLFAGAGLLKGFAITTILAVSVGIFVTRPAYAAIVQMLLEN